MSKDLVLQDKTVQLSSPKELAELANTLKSFVVTNKLYTTIQGKNYVHVEGWQFAGASLGIFPVVKEVTDVSTDKETKYYARVELIRATDGQVIGSSVALCSSSEPKRRNADEYVIASMAQTRATGKAFRLCIGWIMKLAGYEATPSEEVSDTPEPEVLEPINTIKAKVKVKLQEMDATAKIKTLKQVGKLSEENLIDEDWRRLDRLMGASDEVS